METISCHHTCQLSEIFMGTVREARFLAIFLYDLTRRENHLKFSWGRLFLKLKVD